MRQAEADEASVMPERMCIITRDKQPDNRLIRFVLSPENEVVADLRQRLPGRGVWLTARCDIVHQAVCKNAFQRGFKRPCRTAADIGKQIDKQLHDNALSLLSLLRKAGEATAGFEKVSAVVKSGNAAALVAACDGGADGRAKLKRLFSATADERPVIDIFDSAQLALAFGRPHVVHACVGAGKLAEKLVEAVDRVVYYRSAC